MTVHSREQGYQGRADDSPAAAAADVTGVTGTYVVTGAGSGIGEAIAHRLAAAGARVVVAAHGEDDARRGADAVGGEGVAFDVSDPAAVAQAFAGLGPIDGLVNNAGAGGVSPLVTMTPEQWRRTLSVDLDGSFLCLQAAARSMLRHGRAGSIVNISSVNGRFAHRGLAPYAAAKAGVEMLTKVAALELAQAGIRVNAVAPGAVDTKMAAGVLADPAARAAMVAAIPLGRIPAPDEIADIVVFLCSPASRWLTEQTLLADGGVSLRVEPAFTPDERWSRDALARALGGA